MNIYNMAAFPQLGSPEWMWYQQVRMNHCESAGPTPADFQAFNLRPRAQIHQGNMRPRFAQTGQRSRGPPPPYLMVNHLTNSTPQGMMNSRRYQPPVCMENRPNPNPIEGLQELVKGPQGASPPLNQCISPANQHISMETAPRCRSPLSYMDTSQSLPITHQAPSSGSQVRGHLHPNISQYMSHSGMRMPVSISNCPVRFPPPLMKANRTLVQPTEQFHGPWTSQSGNVGYRPGLSYHVNRFPQGNKTYPNQTQTATHGGHVPNLHVSADNNGTRLQQTPSLQTTCSFNKDVESVNSNSNGTLSNSIFGRWYKPPIEDEEVKYDYIFDVADDDDDDDTQSNELDKNGLENTKTKTSSHLIKRPSRLSHEKKGVKGKRLEGEISRLFGSFQTQLSPLSSCRQAESRTGFETEPDIANDCSSSRTVQSSENISSSNVSWGNHQLSSSAIETNCNKNVDREINNSGSQDTNHLTAVHNNSSTNGHHVPCITSRPMPPLMLAPMSYKPVTLQSGQHLLPPALTNLSTNRSVAPQKIQSNSPVVSQDSPVNSVLHRPSVNSTGHSVTRTEEGSESNLCILDTYSLSQVSDIVIQPQELNVNQQSSSTSLETSALDDSKIQDPVNKTSSKCDSSSDKVFKVKKVTPLRIRLPAVLKSRLQEKLKKKSKKISKNDNVTPIRKTLPQDDVCSGTEEQQDPAYLEKETQNIPVEALAEKHDEQVICSNDEYTRGESMNSNITLHRDSICTHDLTQDNSSLPTQTTLQLEKTNHHKEYSEHTEPVNKLLTADNKKTHSGNKTEIPEDSPADRLKKVVSKISSGRKRRKSAVLLETQPVTPDAKRRRLSKEQELNSDAICQKTVTAELNLAAENSNHCEKDHTEDASDLSEQSGNMSGSVDTISSRQLSHVSRSLNVDIDEPNTCKETLSAGCINTWKPPSESQTEKHLEKELSVCLDEDLPKIVHIPRFRRARVSKRPWLMKKKDVDVTAVQDNTGDSEGCAIYSKGGNTSSQRLLIDESNEESLENKSDIEKYQERTKSLRIKLRRISFPPSSLKDCNGTSNKKGLAVKQIPEKEKKGESRKLNKRTDRKSLEKLVARQQQSAETLLESGKKQGTSVNEKGLDENMNNNNSDVMACTELSSVQHMDCPIIEESTVHTSNTFPVVHDTEEIDKESTARNVVSEDLTVGDTNSSVTDIPVSKEGEEIEEESDGEEEVISVGHKPRDTFDINMVDSLFFQVTFHGSKLLCISCLSGKYFVVRELLNKCFIDIAEKNRKKGMFCSKLFKQVYVAKERDLNIPYVELPESLRSNVGDYLLKEQLLRKELVCHIGIIHVNDAKRLYHFFFGVKSCHDLDCVLPWPSRETMNPTDEVRKDNRKEQLNLEKKDSHVMEKIDVEMKESGLAENEVEVITCQVIFDREVKDLPEVEYKENQDNSNSTMSARDSSVEPENCSKVPKLSPRISGDLDDKLIERLKKRRRVRLSSGKSRDRGDLSDDSDATIPYMDESELESDMECDKRKLSSSVPEKDFESITVREESSPDSGNKNLNVSGITAIEDNADSTTHEGLARHDSDKELEERNGDDQQESRIDPDLNDDYVVRGGIVELYDGIFRFLVINGRKFLPFEDLCQHYEKEELIKCLKSKPGHFKAIRCSTIEADFLNNLEPSLPVLVENATIIEEDFLHCSAKLNFRKLFDCSEHEIVDLTTEDDAVVPHRLVDSPVMTPEASPTLTSPCKLSAFDSFSTEDMVIDTSDDIMMMELGTANCDARDKGSIPTKDGSSADDLSVIDHREQKAVADAFRDIWVENHSLKSKMAIMTQNFEETKKETMDFEATCQQYGDAIELMTKAMQQKCSQDQKEDDS